MIRTDKRTPSVLIQSAAGDIWAKDATEDKALAAFIKAGARPGFRAFILAADAQAHVNSDKQLVCRQRSAIWEVRVLPGPQLEYLREIVA